MTRFPLDVQSTTDAAPGPPVEGVGVRPGDILDGPDGARVVVATGRGGAGRAVAVFDPATGRRRQSTLGGEWRRRERCLGVAGTLDATGDRQWLAVATAASDGSYRSRWGSAPVGATAVDLDAGSIDAPTTAALTDRLADLSGPASVGDEAWRALSVSLREQIGTLADGTEPAVSDSLRRTDVPIPTGEADPLATVDGRSVVPGDRVVETPGVAPLSASRETLADGRCVVALEDGTVYDVVTGTRRSVASGEFRSLFDSASGGVVCSLLARDCYVDPVGTTRTYSVHAYRLSGGTTPRYLLASETRPGDSPAVEHPLAMRCQRFGDRGRLRETIESVDAIAGVDDPTDGLRERCHTMAARLGREGRP